VRRFLDNKVTLHAGDCLDVLKGLPDSSIDSCVTDPPYALVSIVKRFGKEGSAPAKSNGASGVYQRASSGFMGKQWDTGDRAFSVEFWREVWRVLKPGAHLVAFSGTRTYHRLACAVEDAGFEIRDQVGWTFGSGFPKSHKIGDGWGTALKPAWEPIVLARKPLSEGTVAANVGRWGCGAINVDGCRVSFASDDDERESKEKNRHADFDSGPRKNAVFGSDNRDRSAQGNYDSVGRRRWPANLITDGSDEVVAAFPETKSGSLQTHHNLRESENGSMSKNYARSPRQDMGGDSGSAARFFYSSKADQDDRLGSKHPTVKPVDLMRYLVRLVTPKGGIVLDPFSGTGTTGEAAFREGMMTRRPHLNLSPRPAMASKPREDARTRPPADPAIDYCPCGSPAMYGFQMGGKAISPLPALRSRVASSPNRLKPPEIRGSRGDDGPMAEGCWRRPLPSPRRHFASAGHAACRWDFVDHRRPPAGEKQCWKNSIRSRRCNRSRALGQGAISLRSRRTCARRKWRPNGRGNSSAPIARARLRTPRST
jgi:site-specific DNA-methyltransferase (adenine-specific)